MDVAVAWLAAGCVFLVYVVVSYRHLKSDFADRSRLLFDMTAVCIAGLFCGNLVIIPAEEHWDYMAYMIDMSIVVGFILGALEAYSWPRRWEWVKEQQQKRQLKN